MSPHRDSPPPTFVQAHLSRLPAPVLPLWGGHLPVFCRDGRSLLPWPQRAIDRLVAPLVRVPLQRFEVSVFSRYPPTWQRAQLRRFLRRTAPLAVLAEFGPTGVAIMGPCADAGVPLVVHFHGYDAYREPVLDTVGRRYPELFHIARAVVAVSRHMVDQLVRLGAPPARVHLNPCGADTDLFRPRDDLGPGRIILAAGRFVEKKAPHLVLRAFQRVRAKIPDARLLMLGDGPLLPDCRRLARDLFLDDAVEFRGACPHHEVAAAMREARVVVHHAVRARDGDMEGTPVTVLEAGAAGLPVVATRHGGISEVVRHGETGLLVNEGDVEDTAAYLAALLSDADMRTTMGRRAREHVCARYSLQETTDRLWRILIEASASVPAKVAR